VISREERIRELEGKISRCACLALIVSLLPGDLSVIENGASAIQDESGAGWLRLRSWRSKRGNKCVSAYVVIRGFGRGIN